MENVEALKQSYIIQPPTNVSELFVLGLTPIAEIVFLAALLPDNFQNSDDLGSQRWPKFSEYQNFCLKFSSAKIFSEISPVAHP